MLNQNVNLLFSLVAASHILFLGIIVYFHNTKSVTSKIFFIHSFIITIWSVINFFSLESQGEMALLWIRLVMMLAVPHVFLYFLFVINFPNNVLSISKRHFYIYLAILFIMMGLAPTKLVYKTYNIVNGNIVPVPGLAMPFYGFVLVIMTFLTIFFVIKKYFVSDSLEKKQWIWIGSGLVSSYVLLISLVFLRTAIYNDTRFVPYSSLFVFPIFIGASYAILRHNLLNTKVIASEVFTFLIMTMTLIQVFLADNFKALFMSILTTITALGLGIFLVRSVINEVNRRNEVETLAKKLKIANKKLKKLDEAKTEFLSITSHQLRTPLSSIKGYLSMIIDGDFGKFTKHQNEALGRVYSEVERLIRLVQVFLNVSRIESGRLKIANIDFDMQKLIDDVIESLKQPAKNKGLQLIYKHGKEPIMYKGDPDKIKDVVVNLVDNAIKYTQKGKIWVESYLKDEKLVVEVHDTGIGIEPSYASSLFEKFSRAKGIAQIDASGTGLGLFIVKKIIEGHHGSIRAESEGKGKGTTFIFELPLNS